MQNGSRKKNLIKPRKNNKKFAYSVLDTARRMEYTVSITMKEGKTHGRYK